METNTKNTKKLTEKINNMLINNPDRHRYFMDLIKSYSAIPLAKNGEMPSKDIDDFNNTILRDVGISVNDLKPEILESFIDFLEKRSKAIKYIDDFDLGRNSKTLSEVEEDLKSRGIEYEVSSDNRGTTFLEIEPVKSGRKISMNFKEGEPAYYIQKTTLQDGESLNRHAKYDTGKPDMSSGVNKNKMSKNVDVGKFMAKLGEGSPDEIKYTIDPKAVEKLIDGLKNPPEKPETPLPPKP